MLPLFLVIVIDLIGFGMMIPILPFYARDYGASGTMLGLILTSYAAMQFVAAPFWGRLSDRIGRRSVLALTMLGVGGSLIIVGLANSLAMILVGRALGGLFAGNIGVATAYVTDITSEQDRAKGMGMIGAAFGVGFILGPAIAGLLVPYGHNVPILVAAGVSIVNALSIRFRLKETAPTAPRRAASAESPLRNPYIFRLCASNFMFTFAIAQLEAVFAFYMLDRFGCDARQVAHILVAMAMIMVGVQGGLIRRLAPKFGEKKLVIFGSAVLALCFASMPLAGSVALMMIPLCLSSLGRGTAQPALLSLASLGSDASNRGAVMGSFQSAASLARVAGPIVAGALYDLSHAGPFYVAALVMAALAAMSIRTSAPVKAENR